MRQVILDTETTGLSTEHGHRIIEIGCVELINRKLTGKHFHQYINPEREIDEGALAVHGITPTFLMNKPRFCEVVHEFMKFVQDAELIIHNATFDVGFLNYELQLLNQSFKTITEYCRIIDTLALARQMHVGQRNSLDALCKRYSIDNSHRELHGALLDAHLLARVYLAMTGGQATLFGSDELVAANKQVQAAITKAAQVERKNLPVLLANDEELAEHEKFLELMKKKGVCLWVEDGI